MSTPSARAALRTGVPRGKRPRRPEGVSSSYGLPDDLIDASVRRLQRVTAVVAILMALVFIPLAGRYQVTTQLPLELPPDVLRHKSKEILSSLGVDTTDYADSAWGFAFDAELQNHLQSEWAAESARWEAIRAGLARILDAPTHRDRQRDEEVGEDLHAPDSARGELEHHRNEGDVGGREVDQGFPTHVGDLG